MAGVSVGAGASTERWLSREATRVYAVLMVGSDSGDGGSEDLIEKIKANGRRITTRELQRDGGRRYREPGVAREHLDALVTAGRGRWVYAPSSPKGGRPSEVFELTNRESGDNTPDAAA